jgi:hypothetical protein
MDNVLKPGSTRVVQPVEPFRSKVGRFKPGQLARLGQKWVKLNWVNPPGLKCPGSTRFVFELVVFKPGQLARLGRKRVKLSWVNPPGLKRPGLTRFVFELVVFNLVDML